VDALAALGEGVEQADPPIGADGQVGCDLARMGKAARGLGAGFARRHADPQQESGAERRAERGAAGEVDGLPGFEGGAERGVGFGHRAAPQAWPAARATPAAMAL
jgi:hypothetical protein